MRVISLPVTLLLTMLAACGGSEDSPDPPAARAAAPLGPEYVLGFGESVQIDRDLTIEFTSLVEDSRCPLNANCVWAGNARILLTATLPRDVISIELNTSSGPTRSLFDAYGVELRKLEPHPVANPQTAGAPAPASAYEATLFVLPVHP